jgi:hypothetical protein
MLTWAMVWRRPRKLYKDCPTLYNDDGYEGDEEEVDSGE